jgi:hypothetical protein
LVHAFTQVPWACFFAFERHELHAMTQLVVAASHAGHSRSLEGGGDSQPKLPTSFFCLFLCSGKRCRRIVKGCWVRLVSPRP